MRIVREIGSVIHYVLHGDSPKFGLGFAYLASKTQPLPRCASSCSRSEQVKPYRKNLCGKQLRACPATAVRIGDFRSANGGRRTVGVAVAGRWRLRIPRSSQ